MAQALITEEQAREIYGRLIDKAWSDAEHYECFAWAYELVAKILGIEDIAENGHGRVKWSSKVQA